MATQRTRAELREAYYSDNIVYKDLFLDLVESLWNLQDDGAGGGGGALVYKALGTQSGSDDPVLVESALNTITGIVWTRGTTGLYIGTLAGAFPAGKTYFFITAGESDIGAPSGGILQAYRMSDNEVRIQCWGDDTGITVSDYGSNSPFSVKIEVDP